uniref:Uncharacterized protein n=1 Tax=Candidatus Kentrum sp. LFY TaxID=2126342 RepID=A0A450WKM8_9GAMM|nr:MAG: hypothetical protein BECKLFY1418C_GA0070996_103319 [Candidatus Kentron sp. LFY]
MKKIIYLLFIFILLSGCASVAEKSCHNKYPPPPTDSNPTDNWEAKHVIQIANDGTLMGFREGVNESSCEDIPDRAFNKIFEGIGSFLENKEGKEVVIYIHGGVNTKKVSLNRARKFYEKSKLLKSIRFS